MTLALELARRIHRLPAAAAPPAVREWARAGIIDAIGVTIAGSIEAAPLLLLEVPGIADALGPCVVIGTERRTSALDAALVNGVASHALDYDDVSGAMGGHPSVPLVAPLLALAEMRGAGGAALCSAYLVGFETELRLGRGVHFHHYDKGWHPTATLGTFGAAAACARLAGLGIEQTAVALAIAASLASGLKANFGTMTKPLHVGHCARSGLFAALLAERGFSANPAALEHKQGFLEVFNGAGTYDIDRMLADWGEPYAIEDGQFGLKPYPCCGSTHPAIDMALALVREHKLDAGAVGRIEIMPHRRRLPHTDNPAPATPLAAKFSIQYAVARAIADGAVRLEHFEGRAHEDPGIRRLLALTEARPHPDMGDDAQWGAEVVVTTTEGRRLSRRIDHYAHRGPGGVALGPDELWTKFHDCAARGLPAAQVAPLFERLGALDAQPSLGPLTKLLERPAPAARVAAG